MDETGYDIDYVRLKNGKYPFIKFLDSLNIEERSDVLASIEELRYRLNNNLKISNKLSKYLKNGVFELRVLHKSKTSRSLYFFQKNKKIVFTNGFVKKTNSTPVEELKKAFLLKKIYIQNVQ